MRAGAIRNYKNQISISRNVIIYKFRNISNVSFNAQAKNIFAWALFLYKTYRYLIKHINLLQTYSRHINNFTALSVVGVL